jgi:hypothetical protein
MLPIGIGRTTDASSRLEVGEPEHALLVSNVDAAIAAIREWNHKPANIHVLDGNQQLTTRLMRAISALHSYESAKLLTVLAADEKKRAKL